MQRSSHQPSIRNRVLAILLGAAFGLIPATRRAEAGEFDRYGAIVLRNTANVSVNFQMRLGTRGPWTDFRVPAHERYEIFFKLKYGRAPTPHIRFDGIGGDGRYTCVYYSLEFYEVAYRKWYNGKPYKFEFDSSGKRLDLYKVD